MKDLIDERLVAIDNKIKDMKIEQFERDYGDGNLFRLSDGYCDIMKDVVYNALYAVNDLGEEDYPFNFDKMYDTDLRIVFFMNDKNGDLFELQLCQHFNLAMYNILGDGERQLSGYQYRPQRLEKILSHVAEYFSIYDLKLSYEFYGGVDFVGEHLEINLHISKN